VRKAEVLGEFSARAGGLTDDVAEAFSRLSRNGRLAPDEIRGLLYALPEGQHGRFARAVRSIPASAFGPEGAASFNFLDMLAASPQRMDAMLQMGYGSFASLYRRAGNSVEKMDRYLSTLAELEQRLPPANRAIEYRRLLDQLERGDAQAWLELEDARAARFAPTEARLDPQVIERWIDEELSRLGPPEPSGTQPVQIPGSALPPAPAASLSEALARVDLSWMPVAERAQLKAGWQQYQGRAGRRLHTEDDYIRFVYGKRTGQLPEIRLGPRALGVPGAVEQGAGLVLERVVKEITSDKKVWVDVMMRDELHLTPASSSGAVRRAFVTGFSTLIGSLIPLIPFLLVPLFGISVTAATIMAVPLCAVVLFAVGAYKAITLVGDWRVRGLQMTVIGMVSAAAGYGIGRLLPVSGP